MVVFVNKKPNKATSFQFRYGTYRAAYLFWVARLNSSILVREGSPPYEMGCCFPDTAEQPPPYRTGQYLPSLNALTFLLGFWTMAFSKDLGRNINPGENC